MVAIFTGLGTGFQQGSGAALGGAGILGGGIYGRGGEGVSVNAANGNLLISNQDEFLVGRGHDAVVARTYNSQGQFDDQNGDNWRYSSNRKVFEANGALGQPGSTIKRVSEDGAEITYTYFIF